MQMSNGHNAIQIVNDYIIMFSITEPLPSLVDTFDSEELAGPPKFERVDTNKLNNLIAAVRKDKEKYDDFLYPETEDHETDYENDDSTANILVVETQIVGEAEHDVYKVNQSGITTKEAGSQHQVAVSDFSKQRLLDLEAIKRKCDELARGCRQVLEEGGEAVL